MLKINYIGSHTTIPGWPEHGTIDGLLDALSRWQLCPRINQATSPRLQPHPDRKPYRGPTLRCGGRVFDHDKGHTVYLDGDPIYPDAPTAVTFLGNFAGYSFAFNLTTDDRDLIARLDAAIAANLAKEWAS